MWRTVATMRRTSGHSVALYTSKVSGAALVQLSAYGISGVVLICASCLYPPRPARDGGMFGVFNPVSTLVGAAPVGRPERSCLYARFSVGELLCSCLQERRFGRMLADILKETLARHCRS